MEKISRILPSSPRVQGTDLSAAPPVRPGTPAFGRSVGVSTNDPAQKEARDIAAIQALSDSFFVQGKKEGPQVGVVDAPSTEMVEELDQPNVGRYLDVQV